MASANSPSALTTTTKDLVIMADLNPITFPCLPLFDAEGGHPPRRPTDTALPAIILKPATALPALPAEDIERAVNFARQNKAESTRKAYRSDFASFSVWCNARGVEALPATPETVAAYLAAEAEAGKKPATIGRRAAISYAHKLAGHEPPTNSELVKATLGGIRRAVGAAPARKTPAVAEVTRDMARAAPAGRLKGLRDKALLLLGFGGAFRRSELVALDVADLEKTDDGLRVTIRRSKTDQEGVGCTIAVIRGGACCPVRAVWAWLDAAGITEGPVFRPVRKGGKVRYQRLTAQSVRLVVKAYAASVGLDAAEFSAHSLRSGFLTSAARRGASIFKMRDVSRHKSMDVLQSYVRDADLFRDHAGAGLL
jgi:site-specific recombinase XerD